MTRKLIVTTDRISTSIPSTSPSSSKITSEYAVSQYVQAAQNPVVAGTGLVKDVATNTLNHLNSITASGTTAKCGTLTYDAQGHILTFTPKYYVETCDTITNAVYTNTTDKLIGYSPDVSADKLVQRNNAGQIKIPLTPVATNDAASKKYIDDAIAVLAAIVSVTVVPTQPATPTLNTMYYVGTVAPFQIKLYAKDSTGTPVWYDMGTTELDLTGFVQKTDIVDALDSTATDKPLSAKQGKELNDKKVSVGNVTNMKMWKGTKAEYDAIAAKDAATMYMITDTAGGSSEFNFDSVYPINSIYITLSPVIPPAFKGTWVKIANGRMLMGTDGSTISVGTTGGANSRTIPAGALPAHSHTLTGVTTANGNHTHTRGTMRIKGAIQNIVSKVHDNPSHWGALGWIQNGGAEVGGTSHSYGDLEFNSDGWWEGATSEAAAHTHTVTGNTANTGTGQAMDTTPAYLAVSMFQRVA